MPVKHIAKHVFMVRPQTFRSNEQTQRTNKFQNKLFEQNNYLTSVQNEWTEVKKKLEGHNVIVSAFDESGDDTPDALFPNNWFVSLPDGRFYLFPMMAPNRRLEARLDLLKQISSQAELIDLRFFEAREQFLEGTGSMVLDHRQKVGYACLSSRTHALAIREFEKQSGYKILVFSAFDTAGNEIYHTNVMLALGERFALIYNEGILDPTERKLINNNLRSSGREIIELNTLQLKSFAGNSLQLQNDLGERLWLISSTALSSLSLAQRNFLISENKIIEANIPTIEHLGGGGIRCLIAELFI